MAAGGGPTPEQWEKMSSKDRTVYWVCVAVACAILGGYGNQKFFSKVHVRCLREEAPSLSSMLFV